jgi:hypothetical protein
VEFPKIVANLNTRASIDILNYQLARTSMFPVNHMRMNATQDTMSRRQFPTEKLVPGLQLPPPEVVTPVGVPCWSVVMVLSTYPPSALTESSAVSEFVTFPSLSKTCI